MNAKTVDDTKHQSFVRGDHVHHIQTDVIGATRGTVLGVVADLQNQAYAAVQWYGGSLTLTRTYLLERTAQASNPND